MRYAEKLGPPAYCLKEDERAKGEVLIRAATASKRPIRLAKRWIVYRKFGSIYWA
ncbi:MAG: hypothetical protein ACLT0Y_02035 [Christensenellales bacterium]